MQGKKTNGWKKLWKLPNITGITRHDRGISQGRSSFLEKLTRRRIVSCGGRCGKGYRDWLIKEIGVVGADGEDQVLDLFRQLVGLRQIVFLDLRHADEHLVAAEEEDTGIAAVFHVFLRLEERELVAAWLGCVRAELRAVAALVAHFVDVQDLMTAVGELDDDVCAVRAGIGAVFADGVVRFFRVKYAAISWFSRYSSRILYTA